MERIVNTDKPICPHCNYIYISKEESSIDKIQGEIECPNCDELFYFNTEIIIKYKTFKDISDYLDDKNTIEDNDEDTFKSLLF